MPMLLSSDLQFIVSRIPKDVRDLMTKHPLILGGGFIRSTISGEKVSDVDLFGSDETILKMAAQDLCLLRKGRIHETKYAFTVLAPPRIPVQFIKRWLYPDRDMEKLCREFDYTVCQAAVCFQPAPGFAKNQSGHWISLCSDRFYADLAAKRLVYTVPRRDEEAGGSFLRMRKFLQRGYSIQASSMAKVTARLISKLDFSDHNPKDEEFVATVLLGLLREIDPLAIIDGVEFLDEHEIISLEEA